MADVLAEVYKQFLGKVIRLTTGHQAKVEERTEDRKAGGVYYTPRRSDSRPTTTCSSRQWERCTSSLDLQALRRHS
jgi:hypothetical protein